MDGIFPPLKLVTVSVPKPEADLNSDFAKSLRDLMGLMALPGLWIGRDGQGILQLTFEAIERTLPLRFIYSQVLLEAPSPVNLLMWDRRWESRYNFAFVYRGMPTACFLACAWQPSFALPSWRLGFALCAVSLN